MQPIAYAIKAKNVKKANKLIIEFIKALKVYKQKIQF